MSRKKLMWGLLAATVLLALLTIAAIAAGARAFRRTGGGDGALYAKGVHAVGMAGNLGRTFQSMRSAMRDMIIETDPAENAGYEAALDEGRAILLGSIDRLKSTVKGNAVHENLLDNVDICMKDYFVVTDDMINLAMANRNAEAAALLRNEAVPANRAFAAALTALMDAVDAQAKEQAEANDRAVALGNRLVMFGAVSALLLALAGTATVLLATVLAPRPAAPDAVPGSSLH